MTEMEIALEMVRRAARHEQDAFSLRNPMVTTFMGYKPEEIIALHEDRDRLLVACRCLLNETMYKDHPAQSQMAIDAIAGRE